LLRNTVRDQKDWKTVAFKQFHFFDPTTSGPENFQSSAKKDFFNTIRQKRPFDRLYRIQGGRQAVERSWKNGAGFFRRNLDHQISKSPKPVLSDESARTPNGKPIVIARG
jgi:hypothetical protein